MNDMQEQYFGMHRTPRVSKDYDLIVVGSGLFGAVTACKAKEKGLRCLVLERRKEIGGNILDCDIDGINVHLYGAHIFHTDNERVWQFIRKYATFNNYVHTVLAHNGGRMFHLPVNLTTFHEIYGALRPADIQRIMDKERMCEHYDEPVNLEQKGVDLIGRTIYDLLIKGYTEKQWGRPATSLPSDIITRLPVRSTYDNRYFADRYQGIPTQGYRHIIRGLLNGIEVLTGVDFLGNRDIWMSKACRVVYTGMVDELLDYRFGPLAYRSLEFHTERLPVSDWQGTAVINETSLDVPYTRTIEHKHFRPDIATDHTIITREYPKTWHKGDEAYYPVNDNYNNNLYKRYRDAVAVLMPDIVLGGRLGLYRYFDMDDAVATALDLKI